MIGPSLSPMPMLFCILSQSKPSPWVILTWGICDLRADGTCSRSRLGFSPLSSCGSFWQSNSRKLKLFRMVEGRCGKWLLREGKDGFGGRTEWARHKIAISSEGGLGVAVRQGSVLHLVEEAIRRISIHVNGDYSPGEWPPGNVGFKNLSLLGIQKFLRQSFEW